MITDLLKRWTVAGLGLFVLTKEKVDELVSDLVKQGQVQKEDARELAENLLKQADAQRREVVGLVEQQVGRLIKNAGFVTNDELQALKDRVQQLEERLAAAESSDGTEAPSTDSRPESDAGPSDSATP